MLFEGEKKQCTASYFQPFGIKQPDARLPAPVR